jgi:putative hydrolase of the HAD superfamily
VASVFFDLVGTLIGARGSIGTQYAEVAGQFGIEADSRALDRVFPGVLSRFPTFALPDPADPDVAGREKQAWHVIVGTVFEEAGYGSMRGSASFSEYFEALFAHFATPDAWIIYPDVRPALEALRDAGHPLGLISNFDNRVFPLFDRLGLAAMFSSVTIPALAGAVKPDPRIFNHALRAHRIVAAEAAYVGDSIADDVLPARAAGMTAILIDRDGRSPAVAGVPRVHSLADLESLLRPAAARTPR